VAATSTSAKAADVVQAASGALAGAIAPDVMGPEGLLWVVAALGICSLADVMTPAAAGRARLAARYLASVAVTLSASYVAAAWVLREVPAWRGDLWAVRIGAALLAGLLLHPVIAMAPRMVTDLWAALLDWLRGKSVRTGD
jgi:multisubunit Na+/H+ antiporter MnhG subunit